MNKIKNKKTIHYKIWNIKSKYITYKITYNKHNKIKINFKNYWNSTHWKIYLERDDMENIRPLIKYQKNETYTFIPEFSLKNFTRQAF